MTRLRWLQMLCLIGLLASHPVLAQEGISWGDESAAVTKAEFLEMFFQLTMHNHEKGKAINSFSLIFFYPSSTPSSAVLFVIQSYNDNGASSLGPNTKREIRKVADAIVAQFVATCGLPTVQKRWKLDNPGRRIVIKHVRASDVRETLAVTIDGVTSFESVDFKRAEFQVKLAGGMWTW